MDFIVLLRNGHNFEPKKLIFWLFFRGFLFAPSYTLRFVPHKGLIKLHKPAKFH